MINAATDIDWMTVFLIVLSPVIIWR
ncbi:hypothetical protein JV46_27330 [Solemya velum gill symbiont]|uniref:Uncharacterized protein n=1 Tax=Solemya velum gill symbiont TaxID=2340 RepID=A0A0B0H273_SOVGS|nr:hypothetical protein JV46_27330 [Solemya velum gill symbiont]